MATPVKQTSPTRATRPKQGGQKTAVRKTPLLPSRYLATGFHELPTHPSARGWQKTAVLQLQQQQGNAYVQRLLTFQHALPGTVYRDKDSESAARDKILDEISTDMNPSEDIKKKMRSAMRAFALDQLQQMQKAGLKFWGGQGLPPEFDGIVTMAKDLASPGAYSEIVRVIRLSSRAGSGHIRHELAHAWDHLRTLDKPKPLKGRKAIEQSVTNPGEYWSASKTKRVTSQPQAGGKQKKVKLSVTEMFDLYKGRIPRREVAFDNPETREGHSMRSPQEFYAEGYSVFHGPHLTSQMRLRLYAPELYHLLKTEALAKKMAVPDEAELDKTEKEAGY